MKHWYSLVSLILLGVILLSCANTPLQQQPQQHSGQVRSLDGAQSKAGTLLWSDEFHSASGTPPNREKWAFSAGGNGWGNKQLQYYTTNATQDGHGDLLLRAEQAQRPLHCWYGTCAYTSARITTYKRFNFTYGELDADIALPQGKGIWSAFWLVGANCATVGFPKCGEIDVAESKGDGVVIGSIHSPGVNRYALYGHDAGAFHRYTLRWTPTRIDLLIDGVSHMTATKARLGAAWVFDHPFTIILNVAVGGNWTGSPDGTTVFPQVMSVHYIRLSSIKM